MDKGFVEAGARARGKTPEERLLAIFDVFDDWFASPEFDTCSFINVLLEMGPQHELGRASIRHLETSVQSSASWPTRRACATPTRSRAPGTS